MNPTAKTVAKDMDFKYYEYECFLLVLQRIETDLFAHLYCRF